MAFATRLSFGVGSWCVVSIALLDYLAILTPARLFISTFVGLLVLVTLLLPDPPSADQLIGVVAIAASGLFIYVVVVIMRFQYLT